MKLSEIPVAIVNSTGSVLYILAEIYEDNNSKTVLRADSVDAHKELMASLRKESGDLKVLSLGGGWISIDQNTKTLNFFGLSGTFGPADHKTAAQLAKNLFHGYTIKIVGKVYHNV